MPKARNRQFTMTRKQRGLFYFVSVAYFLNKQAVSFRVCGNFCGANWCNGGKRSEWTSDDNHCGPEYLVPQENRKPVDRRALMLAVRTTIFAAVQEEMICHPQYC